MDLFYARISVASENIQEAHLVPRTSPRIYSGCVAGRGRMVPFIMRKQTMRKSIRPRLDQELNEAGHMRGEAGLLLDRCSYLRTCTRSVIWSIFFLAVVVEFKPSACLDIESFDHRLRLIQPCTREGDVTSGE